MTDPEKQTVRYGWTPAGERESITYPDGSTVRYGYDTAGRISQVTDGQEAAAAYRYDAAGHILERMLLNGIKTEYTYGELGMVESLIHSDQTGQLDAFSYIYDPAGNRTEIQRTRRLSGGTDETSVSGYVYDSMNRLTEVSRDGALLRSYGYDALGNRIMMANAQSGVRTNYEYNSLNQLTRLTGADGEQALRYDRRSNLASASKGGVFQKSFRFDAANRMVRAVTATGDTAAYTYDGFGRRVKSVWDTAAATGREAQHEEKRYVLDALKPYDNILMAYGADGAARHIWGNELIRAGNNSPGADGFDKNGFGGTDPVYYLNDELRTPVRVTDAAGGSLSHFDHDEFGVPMPQEPGGSGSGAGSGAEPFGAKSDAEPFSVSLFGFTGYQPDPVTGLCYAQARYYMPQTGRFVSEDNYKGVTSEISSLNYYTYCNNNPLRFIDPSGNTLFDVSNTLQYKNTEALIPSTERGLTDLNNAFNAVGDQLTNADFGSVPVPNRYSNYQQVEQNTTAISSIIPNIKDDIINKVGEKHPVLANDLRNLDFTNSDVNKVLKSNYISAYKGKLVIRKAGFSNRSFSFEVMFISPTERPNTQHGVNTIEHEWGHTQQIDMLAQYGGPIGIDIYLIMALQGMLQGNLPDEKYYKLPLEAWADSIGGVHRFDDACTQDE